MITEIARRWSASADPEARARREEAEKALAAAQWRARRLEDDFYIYGKIDEERFEELREQQSVLIEDITATLEALNTEAGLLTPARADALREAWQAAGMADRRMLLRCALGENGIMVRPAARQGDPTPILERLEFDWLSGGGRVPVLPSG